MKKDIKIYINSARYEVTASIFSNDIGDIESVVIPAPDADPEPERTQIKTLGTLSVEDTQFDVSYEETEITGMEGSHTTVFFDLRRPETVTMLRTGQVSTALVFEKDKRHHCVYNTPYMPFEVVVRTLDVKNQLIEKGLLDIDYIIEIRGARAERTKFSMRVVDRGSLQ